MNRTADFLKCLQLFNKPVCNSGMKLWHVALVFVLFVCNRGDTVQYQGGLRSRELGQDPMFLTPRQVLSSHPLKQMFRLYWLQDRDSMPTWYAINHLKYPIWILNPQPLISFPIPYPQYGSVSQSA